MDPSHAPFLAAIRADVDSDVPRLQYADFLDESGDPDHAERAEFIRVQCALVDMRKNDPRHDDLRDQEKALLRVHWRTWFEPIRELLGEPRFAEQSRSERERFNLVESDPLYGDNWIRREIPDASGSPQLVGRFQRGFFDSMHLGGPNERNSLQLYARLLNRATLNDIHFGGDRIQFEELMIANRRGWLRRLVFPASTEVVDMLVGSEGASELHSLSILFPLRDASQADETPWMLRILWHHPGLSKVRRFTCCLGTPVTCSLPNPAGVLEEMIGSPFLRGLRTLDLRHPSPTPRFLAALLESGTAPNLRELRVVVRESALPAGLIRSLRSRFGDSLELRNTCGWPY